MMIKGTIRQMNDGLVKATQDGMGAKFDNVYLDSWVGVKWLSWRLKSKKKPQVINYLERAVYKKIVSDLVKEELKIVSKRDLKSELTDDLWNQFLQSLSIENLGNPLSLTASTSDEYDDAHIKTAKTKEKTIIVTGDKKMIEKDDIVWFYGKLRKIHGED